MRRLGLIGGVLGLCLAPMTASANFVISHTAEAGAGSLTGYHIYRFYALNTQTGLNPTSKELAGIDITMKALGGSHKYDIQDLNSDGLNDVNLYGVGMTGANALGSFMRVGSEAQASTGFYVTNFTPNLSTVSQDAVAYFAARDSFRVIVVNRLGQRPNATAAATGGIGTLFGVAVVPLNTGVQLTGEIADDISAAPLPAEGVPGMPIAAPIPTDPMAGDPVAATPGWVQVNYTAQVPEPTSIAMLALASGAVMLRRRRA